MSAASAGTTSKPRSLACARCGAAFSCGSGGRNGGCWCADEPVRLPMPGTGEDCLCLACVRAAAQASGPSA